MTDNIDYEAEERAINGSLQCEAFVGLAYKGIKDKDGNDIVTRFLSNSDLWNHHNDEKLPFDRKAELHQAFNMHAERGQASDDPEINAKLSKEISELKTYKEAKEFVANIMENHINL